jgi:Transcriptional regulatory protein, C terminal
MMAGKSFIFSFDDVEVHEREFTLVKAGEVLPVEPKAFRVLLILLRNPGKLIGKEDLLNAVWGDAAVTDNSLAGGPGPSHSGTGDRRKCLFRDHSRKTPIGQERVWHPFGF